MRKKILFLVLILALCFVTNKVCADYIDLPTLDVLSYFAQKSGHTKKFNKLVDAAPSRLEWAGFLNEVVWIIEEKNMLLNETEDEKLRTLVKYFDRELLLMNLSDKLEEKPVFNMEAEYSLNSDYLWGEGVRTSVLSLYNELRLIFSARKKSTAGYLSLRNFGYWGVNEYSSGSLGINFKTSDPPFIEQLFFETGEVYKLILGRRYMKMGTWGLAVNWLYEPIDIAEFAVTSNNFTGRVAAASRYENIDYYLASFGFGTEILQTEINGFYSAISSRILERLVGANNDIGGSLSFAFSPIKYVSFRSEAGVYKKTPSSLEVYPYVYAVDSDFRDFGFSFLYGYIPDIRFPTYPSVPYSATVNRPPLDFIDKNFIGTRFYPKTRGYDAIFRIKYAAPVFFEIEHSDINGLAVDIRFKRNTARGIYKSPGKSSPVDRIIIDITVVDYESDDIQQQEWQLRSQAAFRF